MSGLAGRIAAATEFSEYAAGLDFAADVAHAEARWQTELAMRSGSTTAPDMVHTYAAERASKIEAAIRAVAANFRPAFPAAAAEDSP